MEFLADIAGNMFVAALLTTVGHFVIRLLPLVSDRVNTRADNRAWTHKVVTLPIVNGKPLIFIPTDWVRTTLLMYAGRFYETSVLSYAQDEQSVVTHDGEVIRTPKDRLRTQHGLRRGRETIRTVTLRAEGAGDDLIETFRRFVADRYRTAA